MGKPKLKAVGFVSIVASGIRVNGKRIPDVDFATDIFEGETIEQAVLRATAEQKPFRVARLVHARGRSKGESKQT